ncbi:MAG: type II toxin-antitoxin system VapC family toxin [Angustibacter sp.]
MIYLDSSALLKLLRAEQESPALSTWLARRRAPLITSELGRVEVVRAAHRIGRPLRDRAGDLLADLDLLPLDRAVQDRACDIGGPRLRALDALHLASADLVRSDLTAFVCYDRRLGVEARSVGLPVASPGQGRTGRGG